MKIFNLSISLIILFTGCSVKEYRLFQNEDTSLINESQDINIKYSSKIMVDDILWIDIFNMNQQSNVSASATLLNGHAGVGRGNEFVVSTEGTIYLPLLHEVKVEGLTVSQLNKKLMNNYRKYLKQPYIKVRVKNHKIFVLGEVATRGVLNIEGNSISVIEALSKSGGFTDYALRDRLRIISSENGKHKIRTLDLTKLSTLNIKNLMLKPNTIVYVEPKSTKAFNVNLQDYLPIIQAISSLAGTFLLFDYIGAR